MFINKTRNILDLNRFNEEAKVLNTKIQFIVKFNDDDLRFTLSESLTAQEEADLDNFIINFVDTDPELKIPKIYDLTNSNGKHFHAINYRSEGGTSLNLIPIRTVTKGEVTKVEWFRTLDANMQPIDKVLIVDIGYNRDATGFATWRTVTRTWINRDDSENPDKKITMKYYFLNPVDMVVEGLKRRKNLVNSIQIPTLTFMMEVLMPLGYTQASVVLLGRAFMDVYEQDFANFIENSSTITDPADAEFGKKSIIVKLENNNPSGINSDFNVWLDKAPPSLGGSTTIRQYLISEFNI